MPSELLLLNPSADTYPSVCTSEYRQPLKFSRRGWIKVDKKTVRITFVFIFIVVKCRMDDILEMGKDQAEHDQRLNQIRDRLAKRGLYLNVH